MPKHDGPSKAVVPYGPAPSKRNHRTRTLAAADEVVALKAMRALSIDPSAVVAADGSGLASAMRGMGLKFRATEEGEIDPGDGAAHANAGVEGYDPEQVVYPQPEFDAEIPACYWGPGSMEPWSWLDEEDEELTFEECVARGYPARLHTEADDDACLVVYAAAMASGMLASYERAQYYRGVDELTLRLHLVHTVLKERDAARGRYRGNFDTFMEDRMREFDAEFERVVTCVPKVWTDETTFRASSQAAVISALSMTFLEDDATEQWPWYTVPKPLGLPDLGRFGECAFDAIAAANVGDDDLEPLMEGMHVGEGFDGDGDGNGEEFDQDDLMDGTYEPEDEGEDMEAFAKGLQGVVDGQWTKLSA